jgi:hypothetical protein
MRITRNAIVMLALIGGCGGSGGPEVGGGERGRMDWLGNGEEGESCSWDWQCSSERGLVCEEGSCAAAAAVRVTGTVTGEAGDPKSLAGVNLFGPGVYPSMTDSMGRFSVGSVKPGKYVIRVEQESYLQSFVTTIDADSSELELVVKW